jgi:hypothetical protein
MIASLSYGAMCTAVTSTRPWRKSARRMVCRQVAHEAAAQTTLVAFPCPTPAMTVTSELGPNEPVTDAKIGLVLALLGGKIAQILESPSPPCSESP